jgi:4-amino-4-deoxy-L-arabinose transferase-like glycosyltransferase
MFSWSASALGAIGATVGFIAITCWWLVRDHSIPIYDAGSHLVEALQVHGYISSGNVLEPFGYTTVYPPVGHIVGALGMFIGGINVTAPTVAENLVFVPLLALGCYQTAKLLYGERAGLLAVIFAFGSPLIIAQFHVFMLDAPLTALVAVSIWLALASENFDRVGVSALAGLAVGVGLLVKVQFPQFLAGLLLIMLIRGGWRNYKGLAAFAGVAFVIASPWYFVHLSEFGELTENAAGANTPAGNLPPTFSMANFTWYFWNILNSQLLAPLFALAIGGSLWTAVMVVRGEGAQRAARGMFLGGGFLAWVAVTFTPHHDIRYDLALLPYLAVAGAGWIPHLSRVPRIVATVVLVGAVVANTLGMNLGAGKTVSVALVGSPPNTQAVPDRITLYSNEGFLVTAPHRDGDVSGLFQALHREGVQAVTWNYSINPPSFSYLGLQALALLNGLVPTPEESVANSNPQVVALVNEPLSSRLPPPCTRLANGTGVWVLRLKPGTQKLSPYCPLRTPRFYS